ncbi:MAG: molecular chaperone HtpG, partial [Eubacteriales bacterium]|nr:molecular chaperone HtpG [Eubacteriales bacterium]
RGTDITISVSKDSKEFLDEYKIKQVLYKYCSFMPYEIYLVNADIKEKDEKSAARKEEPINDVSPLWLKNPSDCTEENYKEFYHKVFTDFNDPLFWIHLNMDYPFRLKGILYFPKLKNDFGPNDGQIKLYNNQVFVADNIKEVIPEFLLLLKGMLDCPDLPLNVSRSYLQNDGYVNKISSHITKKVSDKLASLYKNERDNYNKYWDDIHPFIKYGCVRDEKFYEKVKDIIIFKTISGEYATLPEFLEKNREKSPDKVFYVTDEKQQAQYIKMYKDGKMDAVILDSLIDTNFIQFLEMKNEKVKFSRIDADLSETMKDEHKSDAPNEDTIKKLTEIFNFAKESKKLEIKVENLKSADTPAIILLSENSRRMQDMTKIFGSMNMTPDMFPVEQTLVLNAKNNLIKRLVSLSEDESNKEDIEMLSRHICDLALIANKQLEPGEMSEFIDRSSKLMVKIAEKQI